MLLAWVSTMVSMTSFPLPFRTAITIASLCTSMPIYLISRLIFVASLGEDHSCQRLSSPKGKCHASADLPMPSCNFFPPHTCSLAAGAERSPAQRSGAQAAPAIPPAQSGRSFIMH